MEDARKQWSSRVYVDPKIRRTDVELPSGFFTSADIQPGQSILVKGKGVSVRLRARENSALRDAEVSMSPMLALFLGIKHVVPLDGEDLSAIKEELTFEMERFADTLGESFDGPKSGTEEEGGKYQGIDLSSEMEGLVVNVEHPERDHLEVEPNPLSVGIPRGEICEDPSLHVKEWTPAGEDGKVKVFRPGGEVDDVDKE